MYVTILKETVRKLDYVNVWAAHVKDYLCK